MSGVSTSRWAGNKKPRGDGRAGESACSIPCFTIVFQVWALAREGVVACDGLWTVFRLERYIPDLSTNLQPSPNHCNPFSQKTSTFLPLLPALLIIPREQRPWSSYAVHASSRLSRHLVSLSTPLTHVFSVSSRLIHRQGLSLYLLFHLHKMLVPPFFTWLLTPSGPRLQCPVFRKFFPAWPSYLKRCPSRHLTLSFTPLLLTLITICDY